MQWQTYLYFCIFAFEIKMCSLQLHICVSSLCRENVNEVQFIQIISRPPKPSHYTVRSDGLRVTQKNSWHSEPLCVI